MTATKRYALAKLFHVTCYLSEQSHNECWPLNKRERAQNPGCVARNCDGLRTKPQVAEAKRLRMEYRRAMEFLDRHVERVIVGEGRMPVSRFAHYRTRPRQDDSTLIA